MIAGKVGSVRVLVALACLAALALLVFASEEASAQGNDIGCPPGSGANAAGTRCTDLATGLEVEPVFQVVGPGESPLTNPCPELFTKAEDGKCVPVSLTPPASAPTPAPAPAKAFPAPAPSPAPKAEAKELPKTGGSATASLLALGAGVLLVGGGLLIRRMR